jgi:hypothetical protein
LIDQINTIDITISLAVLVLADAAMAVAWGPADHITAKTSSSRASGAIEVLVGSEAAHAAVKHASCC